MIINWTAKFRRAQQHGTTTVWSWSGTTSASAVVTQLVRGIYRLPQVISCVFRLTQTASAEYVLPQTQSRKYRVR